MREFLVQRTQDVNICSSRHAQGSCVWRVVTENFAIPAKWQMFTDKEAEPKNFPNGFGGRVVGVKGWDLGMSANAILPLFSWAVCLVWYLPDGEAHQKYTQNLAEVVPRRF